MQLKFTHDIENNVFSTKITIDSFGTEQLSEDEEKELLNDFPAKIAYRALTFTKNVTMSGSIPVVTDTVITSENDTEIVSVTIPPISNKEILLGEDFEATYKVDVNKIVNSAVDENVLTTKDLVAQAYCAVFDEVVRDAVETIMIDLRAKAPSFTGETIVSV